MEKVGKDMEVYISVKNFGKIKEARINISSFTVFVGNNNSGKTQLMELIYAVIKHTSALAPDIETSRISDIDAFFMGTREIGQLNEWVNAYLADHIDEIIESTFNASISIDEIMVEFEGADSGYEIYFLTDKTIEYLSEEGLITQDELMKTLLDQERYYNSLILRKTGDRRERYRQRRGFSKGIPLEVARQLEIGSILAKIMGGDSPLSSNVLFLPASRMGLMLLYKHYFGSTGREQEEMIQDRNQNSKGMTKPVLDFLSFLLTYNYTERTAKKNEELTDFIFHHLIDGKISEKGEVTVYTPNDQNKEIPIFVASSMVNEVVPVVKALTDSEQVDFIFYDEVETSMHPLKQIEMVKLLNRLHNKGFRLIVSTHSDTMATKINNLLLLSQADLDLEATKAVLEKNGITLTKEDLLNAADIHVYQFLNGAQGKSIVEELEFRKVPCTGYDFSLFNDSTTRLFEEAKVAMGIEDED